MAGTHDPFRASGWPNQLTLFKPNSRQRDDAELHAGLKLSSAHRKRLQWGRPSVGCSLPSPGAYLLGGPDAGTIGAGIEGAWETQSLLLADSGHVAARRVHREVHCGCADFITQWCVHRWSFRRMP